MNQIHVPSIVMTSDHMCVYLAFWKTTVTNYSKIFTIIKIITADRIQIFAITRYVYIVSNRKYDRSL